MLVSPRVWEDMTPEQLQYGVNKMQWYCEKFGGESRVMPMISRLSSVFESIGLPKYSLEGNTGPTLDGHRLAHFMKEEYSQSHQDVFMDTIMIDYFCNSKAPCDETALLAACEKSFEANTSANAEEQKANLARAEEVMRDKSKYRDEVLAQVRDVQGRISGVPHFIIRNEDTKKKVEFSGAQPVETFLDAFEELGGEGLELQ
jgi:predicted DsbA family dithiol-disulfide isomerase